MSLPFRQVLLLVLCYTTLVVAWGWRLHAADSMPDAEQMLLTKTRAQIAARIAPLPPALQQPALFQLALLPDREVRALRAWAACSPEQRLRQLTVQSGPVATSCPLNNALVFAELSRPDVLPPDDTRLLISAAGDRLEEPHKVAALELLAAQAASTRAFDVALEIHLRITESPAVTWRHVLALTEAARQARRPAAALRILGIWLDPAAARLTPAQRENALDLQTELLLEGGRHAEACRLALEALRALKPGEAIPPRLLERALLAAHAAAESVELLPWLERHLRAFAEHRLSIEEIAAGKPLTATYLHWLRESAFIADHAHYTSIACDGFFRLAAAGEVRVLPRLHVLATQAGRGAELARLITGLQRRLNPAELAQALVAGGAPQPARDLLISHLKNQPGHREGWRLLTQIDTGLHPEGSAASLWEAFLKRFPADVPALRELAALQVQAGQAPQALRTLQQIPAEHLDTSALRQIAALAIQLDDLPAAYQAQQLLVQGMSRPAISDVMLLASLTRHHADAESQAALASAIAKLPAQSTFQKSLLIPTTTGEATQFNTAGKAR